MRAPGGGGLLLAAVVLLGTPPFETAAGAASPGPVGERSTSGTVQTATRPEVPATGDLPPPAGPERPAADSLHPPTSPDEPAAGRHLEGRSAERQAAAVRLDGLPATFVVGDPAHGEVVFRVHPEEAAERVPPCSTFKIPNALISLEAGAVTLDDHRIARDREAVPAEPWWPKNWDRDSHDLASALQGSVVWYFQELARRVGVETMQRRLDDLSYGDCDLSGGIDRFWLSSTLGISADEQVEFLGTVLRGEAGFAAEHLAFVRDALLIEEGAAPPGAADGGWRWYGKTGSCTLPPSGEGTRGAYRLPEEATWTLWLVGWLEGPAVPGGLRTYAFRVETDGYDEGRRLREELVRPLLVDAGVLPSDAGRR